MPYPPPTTGLGVATQIALDLPFVTVYLSGVTAPVTHQIVPTLQDAAFNTVTAATTLALTAVGAAAGGVAAYTGTFPNGAGNALVGNEFVIAGFVNAVNNGTFIVTASTTTTLTLDNTAGVAETHAGTATSEGVNPFTFRSLNPAFVSVSPSGLATGLRLGHSVVECSYPVFDNTMGNAPLGWPNAKLFKAMSVHVRL